MARLRAPGGDLTRITFQFKHVRKCHPKEWAASEGWCALCILKPGDICFDQIVPFFNGGWTHTIQPYVRNVNKYVCTAERKYSCVLMDTTHECNALYMYEKLCLELCR
jgi:hypothetical protein